MHTGKYAGGDHHVENKYRVWDVNSTKVDWERKREAISRICPLTFACIVLLLQGLMEARIRS